MTSDIDPVTIRLSLESSRDQGVNFDRAWQEATTDIEPEDADERRLLDFMEKHFRAAYYKTAAPEGRCMVPERDTSPAIGTTQRATTVLSNRELCRSGDGCDRPAVRGRFGVHWCEHHARDLEHLSAKLRLDVDKANPRRTQFMRRGMERAA